jgi:hypothetical protein
MQHNELYFLDTPNIWAGWRVARPSTNYPTATTSSRNGSPKDFDARQAFELFQRERTGQPRQSVRDDPGMERGEQLLVRGCCLDQGAIDVLAALILQLVGVIGALVLLKTHPHFSTHSHADRSFSFPAIRGKEIFQASVISPAHPSLSFV